MKEGEIITIDGREFYAATAPLPGGCNGCFFAEHTIFGCKYYFSGRIPCKGFILLSKNDTPRLIGEFFEHDGVIFVVVEDSDDPHACNGCYFDTEKEESFRDIRIFGRCSESVRADNKMVKFIKVTNSKTENHEN